MKVSLIGGNAIRDIAEHESDAVNAGRHGRNTFYFRNGLDQTVHASVVVFPNNSTNTYNVGTVTLAGGASSFETFTDRHQWAKVRVQALVIPTSGTIDVEHDGGR